MLPVKTSIKPLDQLAIDNHILRNKDKRAQSNDNETSSSATPSSLTSSQKPTAITASPSNITSQHHLTVKQASNTTSISPSDSTNGKNNSDGSSGSKSQNQSNSAQTQTHSNAESNSSSSAHTSSHNTTQQTSLANPNRTVVSNSDRNSSVVSNAGQSSNSSQTAAATTISSNIVPSTAPVNGEQEGNFGTNSITNEDIPVEGIASIAVGAASVLFLLTLFLFVCIRRRKKKQVVMDFEDSENHSSSSKFTRVSSSSPPPTYISTANRRESVPKLDIRMVQHEISLQSEEDPAVLSILTGIERRSSLRPSFSDQNHVQETTSEDAKCCQVAQNSRKGSISSVAPSNVTTRTISNSVPFRQISRTENDMAHDIRNEDAMLRESLEQVRSNDNSTSYFAYPTKDSIQPKILRNSILSNLSSS